MQIIILALLFFKDLLHTKIRELCEELDLNDIKAYTESCFWKIIILQKSSKIKGKWLYYYQSGLAEISLFIFTFIFNDSSFPNL